jgi:hypothetical protein
VDTAWDKATKPWAWLMHKFCDMPGWSDWSSFLETEEAEPEPAQVELGVWDQIDVLEKTWDERHPTLPVDVKSLPNTYQVLTVDGRPFTRPKPDRAASRFWNEGKWHTFVEPLLPEDATGQTFVEMGCDVGLFLKMASDHGYQRVIGVEKNKTPVRVGLEWRDAVGGDWTILKRTLGGKFGEAGTFDLDELPVADVTLMSNWHYYVPIGEWMKYLDRLAAKTCSVVIVSRPDLKEKHWMAQANSHAIKGYFSRWNDPKPRWLFTVMFTSPTIKRVPIADIPVLDDEMEQAKERLAHLITLGKADDLLSTTYYREWAKRKAGQWSERTLRRFVQMKADVMRSVMLDGLRDPLIVQQDTMKLSDGGHRLAMLRALGHTSVIVRPV